MEVEAEWHGSEGERWCVAGREEGAHRRSSGANPALRACVCAFVSLPEACVSCEVKGDDDDDTNTTDY